MQRKEIGSKQRLTARRLGIKPAEVESTKENSAPRKERVGSNGSELAEQGSDHTANRANAAEIAELELVLETAVHIHNIVAELHKRGTLEGFSEHISDHVGGLYEVRSENEQKDSALEELGAPLVVASARRSALLLDGGEEGLVIAKDGSRPGDAAAVIG